MVTLSTKEQIIFGFYNLVEDGNNEGGQLWRALQNDFEIFKLFLQEALSRKSYPPRPTLSHSPPLTPTLQRKTRNSKDTGCVLNTFCTGDGLTHRSVDKAGKWGIKTSNVFHSNKDFELFKRLVRVIQLGRLNSVWSTLLE